MTKPKPDTHTMHTMHAVNPGASLVTDMTASATAMLTGQLRMQKHTYVAMATPTAMRG